MPVLTQPGTPGTELVQVPIPTPARQPKQPAPATPAQQPQQQPQDDESMFHQVPGAPLLLLPHAGG